MSSKKRTYVIVAVLLAVVALGIGYAATTDLLSVTGNATAVQSTGAQVEFTGTPTSSGGETGSTASISGSDSSVGICDVALKTKNQQATCTFTISRKSTMDSGVNVTSLAASVYSNAEMTSAWSASNEWFTIATALGDTSLADGETTTLTVTVTLKKANLTGSDVTQSFYIKVTGDAAVA